MKLGILFSGGKDSTLALAKAKEEGHEISCLISIISENKESQSSPNLQIQSGTSRIAIFPTLSEKGNQPY